MLGEILVVMASVAPDPFFSLPYPEEAWTRWSVSGTTTTTILKTRHSSSDGYKWDILIEDAHFILQLSQDRSELLSLTYIDKEGKKTTGEGLMWYSALSPASKTQKKV